MDVSWSDWQIVAAAMREGSFTEAARALGVGQATISRRVALVEETVGHVLFDRHRTGLVPTGAMKRLAPHLEALGAAAVGAARALEGLEVEAAGEVRLAGPPGLCVDLVPALVRRLAETHPAIQLEVLADIDARDLDRREADVALRLVPTTRGDLLVRRLASLRGGLYAAPSFVEALPEPLQPGDVGIVQYAHDQAHVPMSRVLDQLGGRVVVRSNDYLVQRAVVQAGSAAGIFGDSEARALGLVPVPLDLPVEPVAALYLVVHRALRDVPRVAAVIAAVEHVVAMHQAEP